MFFILFVYYTISKAWQSKKKKVTYFNQLIFTEYGTWDLKLFLFILQTNQAISKKLVCILAHFFNDCRVFVLASVTIFFCVFHTFSRVLNKHKLSNRCSHGIFFWKFNKFRLFFHYQTVILNKKAILKKSVIISIGLLLFRTLHYS